MVHVHRHQMEFARLGEHVHTQHGVVLGNTTTNRNAAELVDHQLDGAHDGACGAAVLAGLVERLVWAKRFVRFAAMGLQACANRCIQLCIAVRVCQIVQVLEAQAC